MTMTIPTVTTTLTSAHPHRRKTHHDQQPRPPPPSPRSPCRPPRTQPTSQAPTQKPSALAVDPPGSRFALGSYDFSLSLYDFGGLTSTLKPFRLFEPAESYPVLDLTSTRVDRGCWW